MEAKTVKATAVGSESCGKTQKNIKERQKGRKEDETNE